MKQSIEDVQREMGKLAVSKHAGTILEVLGSDSDTSFTNPVDYQIVQDVATISLGGQQLVPGSNLGLQIQLRDENVLYYMDSTCIAFQLLLPAGVYVENALHLFTPTEFKLGNISNTISQGQYYLEQKFCKSKKKDMETYGPGLLQCLTRPSVMYSARADGSHPNQEYTTYVGGDDTAKPLAIADPSLINAQHKIGYMYDYQAQSGLQVQVGGVNYNIFNVMIPMTLLFPQLKDMFPDEGCPVFCGNNQSFVAYLRTNASAQCLCGIPGNAAVPQATNYGIANMQLVKKFTKLDSERVQLLMKASIPVPIQKVTAIQQLYSQSTNLIYNISSKDKIKYLYIGLHYSGPTAAATLAGTILANYISSQTDVNGEVCQIGHHPAFPINLIAINMGGFSRTFNLQTLQLMHFASIIDDGEEIFDFNSIQRLRKWVLRLDMTRFGLEDMFGSSSGNSISMQVNLQISGAYPFQPNLAGIPVDETDFNAMVQTAAADGNSFTFYSYLETQSPGELKNSIYHML